MEQTPD
jgi:dynactin complex subunit